MRVLLIFLDGVGIGADDAAINPFCSAKLPNLHALLDGQSLTKPVSARNATLTGLDATLGSPGLPQSGTGQASLLTGRNAVQMHGRHFGPWVPSKLQGMVREESVLRQAQAAGHRVAFATAYPEEAVAAAARAAAGARRAASFLRAGPPLAALGAGVLTRHTRHIQKGDAVASEITNDGWRVQLGRTSVPAIDAATAGRNLMRIAQQHDLTLFAHYATDYAGHTGEMAAAVQALERVDAFIGGVIERQPADMMVIVVSDHGNIEDVTAEHTRNPAIGLLIGAGHAAVASRLGSLLDVAPLVRDLLGD